MVRTLTVTAVLAVASALVVPVPANAGKPVCGNGVEQGPEACDGGDLAGETCASLGLGNGTLACHPAGSPEECQFDTSGCGNSHSGAVPEFSFMDFAFTPEEISSGIYDHLLTAKDDDGYITPSLADKAEFGEVIGDMLADAVGTTMQCDTSVIPLGGLAGDYTLTSFERNGRKHCMLWSSQASPSGSYSTSHMGTFVVVEGPGTKFDATAFPRNEVIHLAPHVRSDLDTRFQCLDAMEKSSSRACWLAGSHRRSSATESSCHPDQGHPYYSNMDYRISDTTHNIAETAFPEVRYHIKEFYDSSSLVDWDSFIEWHGMADSSCTDSDVQISHYVNKDISTPVDSNAYKFRDHYAEEMTSLEVTVPDGPGGNECALGGAWQPAQHMDMPEWRVTPTTQLDEDICTMVETFNSGDPDYDPTGPTDEILNEVGIHVEQEKCAPNVGDCSTPTPSLGRLRHGTYVSRAVRKTFEPHIGTNESEADGSDCTRYTPCANSYTGVDQCKSNGTCK